MKPDEDELVEIAVETAKTRQDLRHRPQGGLPELLHQGLRQGRGRGQDAQRLREGQGRSCPTSPWTASCSSTPPCLPVVAKTKFIDSPVARPRQHLHLP
ncbi:MAG: hypothetical protein ACLUJG_10730 [Lawsonibacter sp.]